MEQLVFLLSADSMWAIETANEIDAVSGLQTRVYHKGVGVLDASRKQLPDAILLDLRQASSELLVAFFLCSEELPELRSRALLLIGAADPEDENARAKERAELSMLPQHRLLSRDTDASQIVEVVTQLVKGSGTPGQNARGGNLEALRFPVGLPLHAQLFMGDAADNLSLQHNLAIEGWRTILPEQMNETDFADRRPGLLLVDESGLVVHGDSIQLLLRIQPELRVLLLGGAEMRRSPFGVSMMIPDVSPRDSGLVPRLSRVFDGGSPSAKGHRILLVEDEDAERELLAVGLMRRGNEVFQARDGKEALGWAHLHPPQAMVSDVYMPGMNGYRLLSEIRQQQPELPVIMMAGHNAAVSMLTVARHPRVEFLARPCRPGEIEENLRKLELQS